MGCLALNASFEPLTIIPIRRAIRLVIDRKAEALEVDATRPIRSECLIMDTPVVIRLARYIHVPRRFRRQVTNTFLFARDEYSCQYCGRHRRELGYRESLTRDHITPLSRGGDNGWSNATILTSRFPSVPSKKPSALVRSTPRCSQARFTASLCWICRS